MGERKIEGAVLQSGRMYYAGDEALLAKVLPASDAARLVEKGVLSGDWGQAASVTRIDGQPMERGEDGLIPGDPIAGASGDARPPLEPADPDAPMVLGTSATDETTHGGATHDPADSFPEPATEKPSTKKRK